MLISRFRFSVLALFCLAFALTACTGAGKQNVLSPTISGDTTQCSDVYVYAPAVYIISIMSGQVVALDPSAATFTVFCEPEAAQRALKDALESGKLSAEVDWKVYKVYGLWKDLAEQKADGSYFLKRPAQLVDWVSEE